MERLRLRQREEVFRRLHPGTILASQRQRAANLEEAIRRSMKEALKHAREELRVRIQTIEAMSPMKKLNQGYAFATDEKGRSVRSIKQIKRRPHNALCDRWSHSHDCGRDRGDERWN